MAHTPKSISLGAAKQRFVCQPATSTARNEKRRSSRGNRHCEQEHEHSLVKPDGLERSGCLLATVGQEEKSDQQEKARLSDPSPVLL